MARILTRSVAGVCAIIAAEPIPLADIIPITSAQVLLIIGIGYLAGKEISKDNAIEFLAAIGVNIGAGILMREFTRGLIKFLPVAGNLVSGSMAYAGTIGIGEAAIAYFIDGVSGDEAKKVGEKARKRAEEEGNEEK